MSRRNKPKKRRLIKLHGSQRWQQKVDLFFNKLEQERKKLGIKLDRLLTILTGASVIILGLTLIYVIFINRRKGEEWLYQLQDIDIEKVIASPFEFVVIDYSRDGTEEHRFSKVDIARIKASGKRVLGYLSIGEAENYRYYWKDEWNTQRPSLIGDENPKWKGNFKVKYWDEEWQKIVYKADDSYLDKILEMGFDGVYLDGVDAFEFWIEKVGQNPDSSLFEGIDPREKMIELIIEISRKVKNYDPKLKVYIQNGLKLIDDERVLDAIDGVGKEDLIFIDGKKRPENEINEDLARLDRLIKSKKTVFIAEYTSDENQIKEICSLTFIHRFIPFIGEKDLKNTPMEKVCK